MTDLIDFYGEPIHTYTREQAIEDGVLVDVTETAREAGFKIPVALTAAAWADTVAWTDADEKRKGFTGNDERGRLWDVLWMSMHAIRVAKARGAADAGRVGVQLLRIPRDGRGTMPRKAFLHMVIGGGDAGEPVITIMQPDED